MSEVWPWLALAGLGAFHGLNPAMGWLFAVALGLQRNERRVVWLSLLPLALGHALSIAVVAAGIVLAGIVIDLHHLTIAAGLTLIAWAFWHVCYGSRHRVRIGLQTGMAGLALWSFLMATGHGAGLMLWPVLMPLCFPGGMASTNGGPFVPALLAVAVHTLAMLGVIAGVSMAVYEWIGIAVLRRAWVNLDLIWTVALAMAGTALLSAAWG